MRDPLRTATIVVVDWDLPDLTIRCVEALVGDGVPAERIVLVENGSTKENVARIGAELPDCKLVSLEPNRGYARAANIGAAELAGDAYLFVNNDAFVHRPGSVGRLLESLSDKRVGIAVPRLLNQDLTLQPNVVPPLSPLTALVGATGLTRWIPNRLQPRLAHHWDHGSSRRVYGANGTVLAVSGETWHELEGWAERDLMFAEDLDLCVRAQKAGRSIWFAADAEFVHLGNASVGRQWSDRRRSQAIGRAERALIKAELSPVAARTTLFFKATGTAARVVFFSLKGDRRATDSLRGFLRGLQGR
jgi:N-acetylglucosaminyl-diphospho-decaprenol L-rhamnosyltransferase